MWSFVFRRIPRAHWRLSLWRTLSSFEKGQFLETTRAALDTIEAELGENRRLLQEFSLKRDSEPEFEQLIREEIQQLERQKRLLLASESTHPTASGGRTVPDIQERPGSEHDNLVPASSERFKPHSIASVFLEVQPGAGGIEASIFANELFKMYERYAKRRGWHFQTLDECLARVEGAGAYERLRHEAGGVRVQRVPVTESRGRVHTSLAFVVILPEDRFENNEDASLLHRDELRIDRFRASGAGGQHVNKTDSAVRVTHLPTGLQVAVQTTRSQHQNLALAMRLLRARLMDSQRQARQRQQQEERRGQVGSRARHERVRTFHFPRNEVVDHRVHRRVPDLLRILRDGDVDLLPIPNVEAEMQTH
ncbi:hypothetical protein CCYA_CCYA03G0911 [Cyanidiococcus yangmingshanensis]|nr:hypothetical protein CCYA_CCYA03G0911 [Cyanidiococcus yangmingshanensis]